MSKSKSKSPELTGPATALASVVASGLADVQADAQALNEKIRELQNCHGALTRGDEERLNAIEAAGLAIASKLNALQ